MKLENNIRKTFIFLIFVVFISLTTLRIFLFDMESSKNENQYDRPKARGTIYDSAMRTLATDLRSYKIYLDLGFLRKIMDYPPISFPTLLSNLNINKDPNKLFESDLKFLYLGEYDNITDVYYKIPADLMKFISVNESFRRISLKAPYISYITGRVVDGEGISGVEKFFDKKLRVGEDVVLSVDVVLQEKIYNLLKNNQIKYRAKSAGAIVMETNTGKIVAMVTTRKWNDAIMGIIEPGSAIKPVIYAIALENGVVGYDFTYECKGKIKILEDVDFYIRDLEAHGLTDLKKALVVSCNTTTVMVARKILEKMGKKGFYEWLRKFGLGEKTGIEIHGEIKGILRKPERWSKIDFAEISIGQGIGVTPIQLIAYVNAIFNVGIYVKPTILKNSETVKKRLVRTDVARYITDALKEAVKRGTGELAQICGVVTYGKTGTAQKITNDRTKKYYSIFVGSAVISNKQYTILVYYDEPSGKYYMGGEVSAPTFSEIVKLIADFYEKKPLVVYKGVVPNFIGLSLKDVIYISTRYNYNIKVTGNGVVKKQSPLPGQLYNGEVIHLKLDVP